MKRNYISVNAKYYTQKELFRIIDHNLRNEKIDYLYNLFILETVINTYVDNDGKHKIFSSDTDLVYPDDINRFLEYLYFIVQSAIEFLNELCKILEIKIDMKKLETVDMEDWIKAGKTDFRFIRK